MRTKKRFGAMSPSGALMIATISLALAACGGGNGSSSDETSATSEVDAAATSTLPVTDISAAPTTVPAAVVTTPATVPADLSDPAAKGGDTTGTAPATTAAAATVPPPSLPIPIPAPVDSRGDEPIIDLGTIEIPKIGVNTTLYDGIRLTTLDRGPGHWPGTAMPGQIGNSVIAGHRVSHGKTFRNVDKLVAGDQVIFNTADGRFVYEVTSLEIVTPDAIRIIDQTADKTATLFACHPPGSTRERIVVHLTFVEG